MCTMVEVMKLQNMQIHDIFAINFCHAFELFLSDFSELASVFVKETSIIKYTCKKCKETHHRYIGIHGRTCK